MGEGDESFKSNPGFIIDGVIASYYLTSSVRPSEQEEIFVLISHQHGGSGITAWSTHFCQEADEKGLDYRGFSWLGLSWPGLV